MRKYLGLFALPLVWTLGVLLIASDHIDGPVTREHPVADITDLFAFPSPEQPGHLVLSMAVHPLVARDGHFSDRVNYDFLVRQARISGTGLEAAFETTGDFRFSCTFDAPHEDESPHYVSCSGPSGISVRAQVDDIGGGESNGGHRVFAGRRSDSFFFNLDWANSTSNEGVILPPNDENTMEDMNVLSIVLDVDVTAVFGPEAGSLFAVAAETVAQDGGGSEPRRLDRVGRPEITNVSMVGHGRDKELRDLYNQEEPFNVSNENIDLYRSRLRRNLMFFDNIDGNVDWMPAWGDVLVEMLLADFLVVDMSKPYTKSSYFEIESSTLRGHPNTRCGGRTPDDDIMDTIFTLLINGGHGPQVRDGVDQPSRPAQMLFPYFPEPNDGTWAAIKAYIGRRKVNK